VTALTITLLAGGLCMGVAGILIFVAAVRGGQFDEIEEAKYLLFREDEE
jgi:nitrogen fixation-related uncharacterized protein